MEKKNKPVDFRHSRWRKLIKYMMCKKCKISCSSDVECNPIEDFLNKMERYYHAKK